VAFPTNGVNKTFNFADGLLSTRDPTFSTLGGASAATIVSNTVANTTSNYVGAYINSPASTGPDTECYIELSSGTDYFGVFARLTTPAGSYDAYQASWGSGANNLTLQRNDNAVQTQIGSSVTLAKSAGDSLGIEVTGASPSNSVTCYTSTGGVWTNRITTTDTTAYDTGTVGFDQFQSGGPSIFLDNMGFGAVIADTATYPTANLEWVKGAFPFMPMADRVIGPLSRGSMMDLPGPAPYGGFERFIFPRLHPDYSVAAVSLEGAMTLDHTIAGAVDRETFLVGPQTLPITIAGAVTRETALIGAMTLPITPAGAITRTAFLVGAMTLPIDPAGAVTRTTFLVGDVTLPITIVSDIVGGGLNGTITLPLTIAGAFTRETFLTGAMTLPITIAGAQTRTTFLTGDVQPTFTIAGAVTRTTSVAGTVTFTPTITGDIARLRLLVGTVTFTPAIAGAIAVGVSQALAGTISLPIVFAGDVAPLFTDIPGIGGIAHGRPGHTLGSHRGRLAHNKQGVVT
jgi:hypothetical protein